MRIRLRECSDEDSLLLKEIGQETFRDTFVQDNDPEELEEYLEQAFALGKLEKELADPYSSFFFAEIDGDIAGYVKLNEEGAQTEQMGRDSLEIERIYVRKSHHQQGVGKALMLKAVEEAEVKERNRIWLGVWEKNVHAISFYEKWGFKRTGSHTFMMGDEEQIDLIMTKILTD